MAEEVSLPLPVFIYNLFFLLLIPPSIFGPAGVCLSVPFALLIYGHYVPNQNSGN